MRRTALALASVVAACVKPSAVTCADGRVCPAGTLCHERSLCVTEAQTTACDGIDDGKSCDAEGTRGICETGLCLPGCGDGTPDPDEQCDDGNFASHDGCSSRCADEVPTWLPIESAWQGSSGHSAAYHAALGRLVVFGGLSADGARRAIWQRAPGNRAEIGGGWRDVSPAFAPSDRPSVRTEAAMAYDPIRGVIVLFGGTEVGPTETYLGDTWEYAASTATFNGEVIGTWRQVTMVPSPSARTRATMAFDENLGKIVLYSGFNRDIVTGLLLGDMWTYDGAWTQLTPNTLPPARRDAAMAFDSTRQRLVLYGGLGADSTTHEFDGASWSATSAGPGARTDHTMAFDGQTIVMHGGSVAGQPAADLWSYDGAWQRIDHTTEPPGRRRATLTRDPVADTLVLVGGTAGSSTAPFADLWELASAWTNRTPRFTPPASRLPAAAFSPDHGILLVHGGRDETTAHVESWEHNGTAWHVGVPTVTGRFGHGMVYDSDLRRFVLTGGFCAGGNECDPSNFVNVSTYAFDPVTRTWSNLNAPLPAPTGLGVFLMAYDPSERRALMFGGSDSLGARSTNTWMFDGSAWTQLATTQNPSPGVHLGGAWDPERESLVLFDADGVTWELRDNDWHELIAASPGGPAGREQTAMTYDPFRKRMILASGRASDGTLLDDIWELDTAALTWAQTFVAGQSPLPRVSFAFAMHHNARAVVISGGALGSGGALDDSWYLAYRSTTPDEICTDSIDTDEDGQRDSEDPDCFPPPP